MPSCSTDGSRWWAARKKEFTQIYPQAGWVEHDAEEIYGSQWEVLGRVLREAGISAAEVAAIGITNQRETTIVWDKATGRPIHNAIVWQCRRTAPQCEKMKEDGCEGYVRDNTGLLIDAYFFRHQGQMVARQYPGRPGPGKTGGAAVWDSGHLADLAAHRWKGPCHRLHQRLPYHAVQYPHLGLGREYSLRIGYSTVYVTKSISLFPYLRYHGSGGDGNPHRRRRGDQQAALFGQACFDKGDVKNTYGTGCFLLMHLGQEFCLSRNGLITTLAAGTDGRPGYVMEGSVFVGGAVVQWLRDELGLIEKAADSEFFAAQVPDSGGVVVVPAFTGLGAPYWDMYARGSLFGLTRGAGRSHIIRAALESIAYQSRDLMDALRADTGLGITALKVDGGAAANNFLMQFQADMLGCPVLRPRVTETTALGAALLAGLAVGMWDGTDELRRAWGVERRFEPAMAAEEQTRLLTRWHRAVERSRDWLQAEAE